MLVLILLPFATSKIHKKCENHFTEVRFVSDIICVGKYYAHEEVSDKLECAEKCWKDENCKAMNTFYHKHGPSVSVIV